MNTQPIVWLFHEINDNIIKIIQNISRNDPEAIFTFDDGLYSNYKYLYDLKQLPNKKIFFISLGILRNNNDLPNKEFITCYDAHNQKDTKYYMSLEEINEIEDLDPKYNCFIGLHGLKHLKSTLKNGIISRINYPPVVGKDEIKGLKECKEEFLQDINNMLMLSSVLLNHQPKYFAWPYNIESPFMKTILVHKSKLLGYNFEFFGKERLEFDTGIILQSQKD